MLWIAFVVVHVAGRACSASSCPISPWATSTSSTSPGRRWAIERRRRSSGITEPWVYPQLALVPMVLAHALRVDRRLRGRWAILVTLCDALAFAMLVGRGRSHGRIDRRLVLARVHRCCSGRSGCTGSTAITVPLALAGSLWLVGRPLARLGAAGGRDLDQGLAGSPARGGGHRGAAPPRVLVGRALIVSALRRSRSCSRAGGASLRVRLRHRPGRSRTADRGAGQRAATSGGAVLGVRGSSHLLRPTTSSRSR